MAGEAQGAASRAIAITSHAPSYDGQFGPAVHAIGAEAAARLDAIAGLLSTREEYLTAKSIAFEEADNAVVSGMASVPTMVIPNYFPFKFPQWLIDLLLFILAMVPGGDLIDILQQLGILLKGEDVDDLVLTLAVIGLLMDLGYIDPLPAEEGGNALAAVLKVLAKKIPNGPARDLIARTFREMLENPKEYGKLAKVLKDLITRTDVVTALATKHPDLFAKLLKGGPSAMEALLKHSDDVIVKYLDDLAAKGPKAQEFFEVLAKNPQALEVALRHGPDALDKLSQYGDDGIGLIARYQDDMLEFLVRTSDPAGDLALRTTRALEAAKQLRALGPSALDAAGPTQARALVGELAKDLVQGSGDRLVLGPWVDPKDWATQGGGFVEEALSNGGRYYEMPSAVFMELGGDVKLAQAVNKEIIMDQLQSGIKRIDYMGSGSYDYAFLPHTKSRWLELDTLYKNAASNGYTEVFAGADAYSTPMTSWVLP
jgi:hypothetical protein